MKRATCKACKGKGKVDVYSPSELLAAREAAGLSQGELAARMGGLSSAYVSDIERGKAGFSAAQAGRWLAACNRKRRKKSERSEAPEDLRP